MASAPTDTPLILAIHTATPIGSIAIFEGARLLGTMEIHREKSHARQLTPMIQALLGQLSLQPGQLDAIGIVKGPGSYTGLRVGVSTAKGLCYGLEKPLLSLDSLQALAWPVRGLAQQMGALICPMIDARRMEVYCAIYDEQMQVHSEIRALVLEENSFDDILAERPLIVLGSGAEKAQALLGHRKGAIFLPKNLSNAVSMGEALHMRYQRETFEDLLSFEPFYLKDFVVTKSRNRLLPKSS